MPVKPQFFMGVLKTYEISMKVEKNMRKPLLSMVYSVV